jgi:2-polyprenyl-3-methyl-5-hydroxy-6-metoxy-1,4-benzoquinol methylase
VNVPREKQYAPCFAAEPVGLGPMLSHTWRHDPKRLGFVLARYKHAAKMLAGVHHVAEIGACDGFASAIVAAEVGSLTLFDFDPVFVQLASARGFTAIEWDIVARPLPHHFDAALMLDVFEHIAPHNERLALNHLCGSLTPRGMCVIGTPSAESQNHASPQSKLGHVNCKHGAELRALLRHYFANVVVFSMNDETLHTGFYPMAHYLLALCCGPLA